LLIKTMLYEIADEKIFFIVRILYRSTMSEGRDWSEYNEHLVRRGELYLALDFIDSWNEELSKMNYCKRGHPFEYPESLIRFLAVIYYVMRVPYRALEGILRSLNKYIPALKVADYSTIAKRIKQMKIPDEWLKYGDKGDVAVAMDSTGIKVTNRGDWIRKKWKVRRGWLKVHISVAVDKRRLLAIKVTDEKTADSKMFDELLDESKENMQDGGRIKKVYLDGAYDSKRIFNRLDEEGIEPVVRVRKDASTRARGSPKRAEVVRAVKELGYKEWARKTGYGYRWIVESVISAVKRMFGETVRAHKWDQMVKEVIFRFIFYNVVISI